MAISSSALTQQLKRQLVFLRNSAAAYDAGHIEEAVRIGVVIRVLCHDATYPSLLKQMGLKESMQLVTTARDVPADLMKTIDVAELLVGMTFGQTLSYDPVPEGSPVIPCIDWWTQPVFFRDAVMYTRKDVVLSAANKDGGAHVGVPDSKLRALQSGLWMKTVTKVDGTAMTVSLGDTHFRMLRRFADELLGSHDLLRCIEH
jgi:hypothetical protein